jgi:hypothetical protein
MAVGGHGVVREGVDRRCWGSWAAGTLLTAETIVRRQEPLDDRSTDTPGRRPTTDPQRTYREIGLDVRWLARLREREQLLQLLIKLAGVGQVPPQI